MLEIGSRIDPYREVVGALRRARRDTAARATNPGHGAELLAMLGLVVAVATGAPVAMAAAVALGALALWSASRRGATLPDHGIDAHFDSATGLPLASALPVVVDDGLVLRSLTGRIAVAAVEVPEIAARQIAGDHAAAQALLSAITHRLRRHGWAGDADGPFGPLIFLRRPGVFVVILRDILDERTTRWLASRVHALLDEGVPWSGTTIAPRVVMGVAVGDIAEAQDLIARADEARIRARREPDERVAFHGDDGVEETRGRWSVAHDGAPYGRVLDDPCPAVDDLFASARDLRRRLDTTVRLLERDEGRWLLPVGAATLCHRPTRQQILSALNRSGAHRRLGLIVPPTLDDRLFAEAWKAIEVLRRAGVEVHLDRRAPGAAREPLPRHPIDGIIVGAGAGDRGEPQVAEAHARRLRVLTHAPEAHHPEPMLAAATTATGTDRLILPGHPTQVPKGAVVTIR